MNSHKNARTTLQGRKLLIERIDVFGLMPAAEAAGISVRTARKWRQRLDTDGPAGLADRSSRPHRTRSTVDAELRQRIEPSSCERQGAGCDDQKADAGQPDDVSQVCRPKGTRSFRYWMSQVRELPFGIEKPPRSAIHLILLKKSARQNIAKLQGCFSPSETGDRRS